MPPTPEALFPLLYQYYPRGIGSTDDRDASDAIRATEEYARLVAARKKAGADERWRDLRTRVSERFPDAAIMNHSLHLPSGSMDACYSFAITMDPADGCNYRELWFQISFLAPYYTIFSSRLIEKKTIATPSAFRFQYYGFFFHIPASETLSGLFSNPDDEGLKVCTELDRKSTLSFDLSPDEKAYAEWIAREIEATFGCEPMPKEVGITVVPDVENDLRRIGTATIFDCVFSTHHPWIEPDAAETRPHNLQIEPSRLSEQALDMLTVYVALIYMQLMLIRTRNSGFVMVELDGVPEKKQLARCMAEIRRLLDSDLSAQGLAVKEEVRAKLGEVEALVAAWEEEEEAAPAGLIAWARETLARWILAREGEG